MTTGSPWRNLPRATAAVCREPDLQLYYTPEIVRRFVAGMASSKLLILEGISGTGKTSLPYSFSRYMNNPATIVSVQPSYRDRTELLGYFNEFSKRFQ